MEWTAWVNLISEEQDEGIEWAGGQKALETNSSRAELSLRGRRVQAFGSKGTTLGRQTVLLFRLELSYLYGIAQ
jgi:hypothetical protein